MRDRLSRLFGRKPLLPSNITHSEDIPWTLIGDAEHHLLSELEQLYWIGVEHELESILLTLKTWEEHKQTLPEESDNFVHGFDTFIDQVNEESREFADRVRLMKNEENHKLSSSYSQEYVHSLEESAQFAIAEHKSSQLKAAIREAIEDQQLESPPRRRTRLLLQAIGLLDIEKLVEHRPPLDDSSFKKRPGVPQLKVDKYDKFGMPHVNPLRCASCDSIIRSSMYFKEPEYICEDCYRQEAFGNLEYVKRYKHSIIDNIITSPIGATALKDMLAERKYYGMQKVMMKKNQRTKNRTLANDQREMERMKMIMQKQAQLPKGIMQPSQRALKAAAAAAEAEAAQIDENSPSFLRWYTQKYPFANVHMALRIGPVLIENGVEQ